MPQVKNNYLVRTSPSKTPSRGKASIRDWWLVKTAGSGTKGHLHLANVYLPPEYIGKKVRFRIEIIEECIGVLKKTK